MLLKQAIRQATPQESPTLYRSSFFQTPKKPNTWRLILNLKTLNKQYKRPHRFRMETLAAIIPSLTKGFWATSLDFKDAYLHIPIHPDHQRFLSFNYNGIDYLFEALLFGLWTAPRVFTRVTRAVTSFLRYRGISVFAYLNDRLIVAKTHHEVDGDTKFTIALLQFLRWIVNEEKSSFTPSQHLTFLGARLDLYQGEVFPAEDRLTAISDLAEAILLGCTNLARDWLCLLGLLASFLDVVPLCRLWMRLLLLLLLRQFHPSVDTQAKPKPSDLTSNDGCFNPI